MGADELPPLPSQVILFSMPAGEVEVGFALLFRASQRPSTSLPATPVAPPPQQGDGPAQQLFDEDVM